MHFNISPLSDTFGIEITGLDLSRNLPHGALEEVKHNFFEAGVMVIRDQYLRPEEQIKFSRQFGNLMTHVLDQFLLPGHPEILQVSNKKDAGGNAIGLEDAGRYWHSDISYESVPAKASMLYALEIPPKGGDTLFIDMRRAYDTLPTETQERLRSLRAFHSYTARFKSNIVGGSLRPDLSIDQSAKLDGAWHVAVRTHEDTGRKALYVNPGFTQEIEGLPKLDSTELLQNLFEHVTQKANILRHVWQPRDLLCWDNRSVIHHATLYDPEYTRHMHRTTIEGTVPAG